MRDKEMISHWQTSVRTLPVENLHQRELSHTRKFRLAPVLESSPVDSGNIRESEKCLCVRRSKKQQSYCKRCG